MPLLEKGKKRLEEWWGKRGKIYIEENLCKSFGFSSPSSSPLWRYRRHDLQSRPLLCCGGAAQRNISFLLLLLLYSFFEENRRRGFFLQSNIWKIRSCFRQERTTVQLSNAFLNYVGSNQDRMKVWFSKQFYVALLTQGCETIFFYYFRSNMCYWKQHSFLNIFLEPLRAAQCIFWKRTKDFLTRWPGTSWPTGRRGRPWRRGRTSCSRRCWSKGRTRQGEKSISFHTT